MLVTSAVDIEYLIEKGAIEINPTYIFQSPEDLRNVVETKQFQDRSYIYLPDTIFSKCLNLMEYLEIFGHDTTKLLKYSKSGKKDLETIRIYCESEFLEYISVVDLKYKYFVGVYKLTDIRLWDEIPTTETFTYDFKVNAVDSKVLDTVELKLNLFERKLIQNTIVKGTINMYN
jgi:hypothetical protein|nr:MAG TPA: hypothetical protein [Caudoviricetes sp.]